MGAVYEYKVIGKSEIPVEDNIGTAGASLHYAIDREHNGLNCNLGQIVRILNHLAEDGWEPVTLDFPYVFKRVKPDERVASR